MREYGCANAAMGAWDKCAILPYQHVTALSDHWMIL